MSLFADSTFIEFIKTPFGILVASGGLAILFLSAFLWAVRNLLYICPPNEALVFSGRRHRMADGTYRGFRVIVGGRGWRVPIFERVAKIPLGVMEVPISIRNAYSKGGIPLVLEAVANVKTSSDQKLIGNAIERFLGRDAMSVTRVAKETLEGHLRGVLATLTPTEINEDRLKFAAELSQESEADLNKLGLQLDTLKILHVSDEVHYLDSIGRAAIANVIKDAEIAESDAERDAQQAESQNLARANVAMANADANILKLQNELRKIQADLESNVRSEEERTTAAAREARAKAEQELQKIRAELEGIRLQAETVLPAEANQVARSYQARGEAAAIRERGRAVAQATDLMQSAWGDAGKNAMAIYLIQEIDKILATIAASIARVKVQNLSIIDSGDGETLAAYQHAYAAMVTNTFKTISLTTGLDIPAVISGKEKQQ
ncbi:MAG: SPFH domain-containing protein [Fimbriimonadales bacterium]